MKSFNVVYSPVQGLSYMHQEKNGLLMEQLTNFGNHNITNADAAVTASITAI